MKIELGKDDRGCNVVLQPERAINSHVLCLGASGSGKTVEAQKIMTEIVKQGDTVLAISIHSSLAQDQIYEKYVDDFTHNARHIYVNQEGIPCELFTRATYQDGSVESEDDLIDAVAEAICSAYGLVTNHRILLSRAVEQVVRDGSYVTQGFRAIGMKLQEFQEREADKLFERLKSMFNRNIFRDGTLIEKGKLNIINLDHLDLMTQQMAAEMLLSYIWRNANADSFKKQELWLFLDECQDYGTGRKHALPMLLSEGRKMGVNLILATQVMLGGRKNLLEERIMQCGTRLLFKPAEDRIQQTAKLIDYAKCKDWMSVLAGLKSGEFVACGVKTAGTLILDYPIKVSARDDIK